MSKSHTIMTIWGQRLSYKYFIQVYCCSNLIFVTQLKGRTITFWEERGHWDEGWFFPYFMVFSSYFDHLHAIIEVGGELFFPSKIRVPTFFSSTTPFPNSGHYRVRNNICCSCYNSILVKIFTKVLNVLLLYYRDRPHTCYVINPMTLQSFISCIMHLLYFPYGDIWCLYHKCVVHYKTRNTWCLLPYWI